MPTKPKPMTVLDAYNKAKNKPKSSARENVTRSGQGSGNTAAPRRAKLSGELPSAIKRRNALGDKREKVTRTGQGSGNTGPKKKNKGFFDRVGDIAKGVGRVGEAVVKDSINTVTNPFGAAKSTAQQIGRDVKNKNIAGLGLAAASMIPIPGAKGSAAAIKAAGAASKAATVASTLSKASKAAGKTGKASKTLAQMADDAIKAGAKGAKTPKKIKGIKVEKGGGKFKKDGVYTPPQTKSTPNKLSSLEREKVKKWLKENNGGPLTPSQIAQLETKTGGDIASYTAKIREATPKLKRELARDKTKPVLSKPAPKGTPKPKEKIDTTPKAGSFPKKKPAKPAAATAKPASSSRVSSAQAELDAARKELQALKISKGGKYKESIDYKRITNKITAKEQKVANAVKSEATPPRPQRGVGRVMTDSKPKAGDAQRTYSGVGRSKTPRTGVTESPKPSKGQYEGDLLRGQARDDAANMSNRGLRGSSKATRDGRTAENKAKNVENIRIRENDRKVTKYEEMRQKAIKSKKPKDIQAAKKYAEFWGLKGIKRLK